MTKQHIVFGSGLILSLLFVCGLAGTAAVAQDLKCFILTPPEQVMEGVRQMAVADFSVTSRYESEKKPAGRKSLDKILNTIENVAASGDKGPKPFEDAGKKLADLLITQMVETDRGVKDVGSGFLGLKRKEGKSFQDGARTNVFVVVERQRMEQILEEMKLGQSGLIDETQAAQVGKLLGVDAILTGQVNAAVKDTWDSETRTTTKGSGKNKVEEKKEVWCNKRVATVSATIRIVRVETGQLIGTKEATNKQEVKSCDDDNSSKGLPPADQTIDLCLQNVAKELINYYTPRFEQNKFEFARIEGKEFKRQADAAREFIDQYDLQNAFVNYSAILEQDPYNHAAIFNLGLLHEVVGNYKEAMQNYRTAATLVSKEDKYRKALQRVEKQEKYWELLQSMGVDLKEHDFTVTAEQTTAALVPRIQINGSGADRTALYEKPDTASKVLVRVPGGIELEVTASQGDWYQVKLLDGRLAWVPQDDVRVLK
ncbi:MAG TPA: CsgG/HfaB family protein [bacterium]|nr:CsgG/HfaB family protein [bacterium]HQG44161.1 CsgG/HfaB family protein [bacterium]HQI49366.1 CsgG/HfaB family protein [bacterium]HQJ64873.1 CsgG/HfaB family protein [bacterium]